MADIALRIKADFAQAEKAFKNLSVDSEHLKSQMNDIAKKSAAVSKAMTDTTDRIRLHGIAVSATRGPVAGLAAEQSRLRSAIEKLIRDGINPESEVLSKLRGRLTEVDKQLDKVGKSTAQTGISIKGMITAMIGANLIESGVRAIGNGFKFMVSEARKLEDAEAAFTPLMGGPEKAKELIKELNIEAAQTPFTFETIGKVAKQILPAMNGDIAKTIETFKMLGDTAGGNAQTLESVTRGYMKAVLKGKVDMEALNMINDAGVPIYTELAKSMGVTVAEMVKMSSTGKITADDLTKAFQKMTSEGGIYYRGMIIASQTTSGVFSTLEDNINQTAAGIGQAFLPYLKEAALKIIEISGAILKWVSSGDNLKNLLSTIGTVIEYVVVGFVSWKLALLAVMATQKIMLAMQWVQYLWMMRGAIMSATGATNLWAAAQKALNIVLTMNPIGLVVAGIALLATGIYMLVKNWETVKFHALDFVSSTKIKILELTLWIKEKLVGGVKDMIDMFAQLPTIGVQFRAIQIATQGSSESLKELIDTEKKQQSSARAAYEASMKRADGEKAKIDAMKKGAKDQEEAQKKAAAVMAEAEKKKTKDTENELKLRVEAYNTAYKSINDSFSGLMTAMNNLSQAQFQAEIAALDAKMQKELENAGVSEETQKQQAQREYDAAIATGNALDIEEKRRALVKATIEEKYAKKRKQLEYEAALSAWQYQMAAAIAQAPIAIMNAYASGWAAGPIAGPILAASYAAIAAAGAGVQIAAVAAGKPSAPTAQTGIDYTVPDTRTNRNDRAAVMASAGERVQVTPRGEAANKPSMVNIQIGRETIFRIVQDGIDSGYIDVSDRNIGRGVFAV